MKKFQFKLETVLKLRSRVEEQRQQELRNAQRFQDEAARKLQLRQAQLQEALNAYQKRIYGNLDLLTMINYDKYLAWLHQMLELDHLALKACEAKVAEVRVKLVEASKEKKIVEKLKEKAYLDYQRAELHAEIDFLDELGTSRFNRQEDIGK